MLTKQALYTLLAARGIAYEAIKHPAVFLTLEDVQKLIEDHENPVILCGI